MPPVNREPRLYQGYVISQIGQQRGNRVYLEFKDAQNCVMSGTHRWADDETPVREKAETDALAKEEAARIAADAAHNAAMKAARADQEVETVEVEEIEIPENWRELHHMAIIGLAKKIKGMDNKASLKKADAIKIVEEFIAENDQVRTEEAANEAGKGPESGNRDKREFDPEASAEKAAQGFASGEDDFGE